MTDQWFYAEAGETVGPVSAEALARRIALAQDEPHFVWAPGMPEWVDGRSLPQFAPDPAPPAAALLARSSAARAGADAPSTTAPGSRKRKLMQRARHELVAYISVSTYLMVWFFALLFYKSAVLRTVGVEFAPVGVAVVKALILGKFILVLEAVKLGEKQGSHAILLTQIVSKALIFTVALVILSFVEEIVVGHFHGRGVHEAMSEIAGGSLWQLFASGLLLFLVLLPYLAFRRMAQEIGELPEILFTRRSLEKGSQEA
jgi:hypothetical protein